jgi:hypothetical protein
MAENTPRARRKHCVKCKKWWFDKGACNCKAPTINDAEIAEKFYKEGMTVRELQKAVVNGGFRFTESSSRRAMRELDLPTDPKNARRKMGNVLIEWLNELGRKPTKDERKEAQERFNLAYSTVLDYSKSVYPVEGQTIRKNLFKTDKMSSQDKSICKAEFLPIYEEWAKTKKLDSFGRIPLDILFIKKELEKYNLI